MFHNVSSIATEKKYHVFPRKNVCLTVPTFFVGALICASENFWCQDREGGSRYSVEKFFSQYRKIFWANRFVFHNVSGIKAEEVL